MTERNASDVIVGRRPVELAIMRGGTSRGPVLSFEAAPPEGPARDDFARTLTGRTLADGLGGGTPTTSKIVLVRQSQNGADLEYVVGNLAPAGGAVDWAGTCGNMTAAVVPYAAVTGLLPRRGDDQVFRLRNLATRGLVDVTVHDLGSLDCPGAEIELTTSYLDPGGAVLGTTLPTGNSRDVIQVDGEAIDYTIIDITHPYLLLRHDQVVGRGNVDDTAIAERIERVRGTVCVRLGLCADADAAGQVSAAVPRAVLVHAEPGRGADVRITAVSMGQPIRSVPVSAAMSIAAASGIDGTLISDQARADGDGGICIAGPAASIRATATVDGSGRVARASVDRTARCIMRGTAWA
jgi:2-methylaconitate cis-trans-isomerase PrpF